MPPVYVYIKKTETGVEFVFVLPKMYVKISQEKSRIAKCSKNALVKTYISLAK